MKIKDLKFILFFIFLFVVIRSINFSEHLNFSFDQAWTSTRAIELWKNKEITLVGPGSSLVSNGKQVLQGSINYYFQLVFLLLGNYDPVRSSYLLMVFMGLMIVPLYYGMKLLSDKKSAIFMVLLYTLFPYFIDFTRFFFGPVYLLSFLAMLIMFMGLYKKYKKTIFLFCVFFISGIITQFHYQGLIVSLILFLYYIIISKNKFLSSFASVSGLILGSSPIIIFEIKNDFYNIRVLSEYLKYTKKPSDFFFIPHRYLSISLILLVIAAPIYKKYVQIKTLLILSCAFLIVDLALYLPKPETAFGMSTNWNYPSEKKAYEIIKKEGLKNFNIVNHIYDNKSTVIKYHLKLDKYDFDYDDYYHNKYLFVISDTEKIFNDPAYEINTFQPSKKIKQWKLNDVFNLYLFERIKVR